MKKLLSFILVLLLTTNIFTVSAVDIASSTDPIMVVSQVTDTLSVTYNASQEWGGRRTVEVKLDNKGATAIENWSLAFSSPGKITGIWNAQILKQNGENYLIKNAVHNKDIPANGQITFGYTLTDGSDAAPSFVYATKRTDVSDNVSVSFDVVSDWGGTFQGEIKINNDTDEAINGWTLTFDKNFYLYSIWGCKVYTQSQKQAGKKTIVTGEYNSIDIPAGATHTLSLTGAKIDNEPPKISDIVVSGFVFDESTVENSGEIGENSTPFVAAASFTPPNVISFAWTSAGENGSYTLLASDSENSGYTQIAEIGSVNEYNYTITEAFETKYFKIKFTDGNKTYETNAVIIKGEGGNYAMESVDSDNDDLPDYLELYLGLNTQSDDTDMDGLSDVTEINLTYTDPSIFDSIIEGISDSDADFDGDGLSTKAELIAGTHVLHPDTDHDGINDSDEINIHGTNPNKPDNFEIENSETTARTLASNLNISKNFSTQVLGSNTGTPSTHGNVNNGVNIVFLFDTRDVFTDARIKQINAELKKVYDHATYEGNCTDARIFAIDLGTDERATTVRNNGRKLSRLNLNSYNLIDDTESLVYSDALKYVSEIASANSEYPTYVFSVLDERRLVFKYPSGVQYANQCAANGIIISDILTITGDEVGFLVDTRNSTSGIHIDNYDFSDEVLRFVFGDYRQKYIKDSKTFLMSSSLTEITLDDVLNINDYESYKTFHSKTSIVVGGADTDNDNLQDFAELDFSDKRFSGGDIYIDGDDLYFCSVRDYIKRHNITEYISDEYMDYPVLPVITDPTYWDSDGDTISDYDEYLIGTESLGTDSDHDGLDDGEEYWIDVNPLDIDSDNDGLLDNLEFTDWFDALKSNPDGDSYSDLDEYNNNTNPFHADMTPAEFAEDFYLGAIFGDIIEDPNIPQLIGAIAGGIIPVAGTFADIRDAFANWTYGNWGIALISAVGVVPVGGDAVKSVSKVGKFITKNIDKLDEIAQFLEDIYRIAPDLVKKIPADKFDEIIESIKTGKGITKHQYNSLSKMVKSVGKEMPENFPFKSYQAFKNFYGNAGEGKEWHHIVEQCQEHTTRSGFPAGTINCMTNVIALDKATHKLVTDYYSRIDPFISSTMRVRDWLIGKPFEYQYEFGMNYLRKIGAIQ